MDVLTINRQFKTYWTSKYNELDGLLSPATKSIDFRQNRRVVNLDVSMSFFSDLNREQCVLGVNVTLVWDTSDTMKLSLFVKNNDSYEEFSESVYEDEIQDEFDYIYEIIQKYV